MNIVFHLFSEGYLWLFSVLLSTARIFPSFVLIPWLGSGTVSATLKYPLAFLLGGSLWQFPGQWVYEIDSTMMTLLIIKELMVGIIIALFLCLPYWAMHAAGSIIDNQRGATLSSTLSPMSGIDSSEMANFFNMLGVVIILQSGGVQTYVETLHQSYQLWSPLRPGLPHLTELLGYVGVLMVNALRIASPVVTMFLATELLLGFLSRYAPQMNAFSLAMVVKTPVGLAVLLLYLSPALPSDLQQLQHFFKFTG